MLCRLGEAAFEGVPVRAVEIPTAFSGCKDLNIFAPDGSLARYLRAEENGFVTSFP